MLRCGTCDREGFRSCLAPRLHINDNRDVSRACCWNPSHGCFSAARVCWICWRFILFAIFLAGFIGSVMQAGPVYLTFLTNYSYLFLVGTTALLFVQTVLFSSCPDRWASKRAPVTTILYEITAPSAVVVTILYFGLLNPQFNWVSIFQHLINSILIVIDLILSGVRFQPFGFLWVFAYFFVYLTYALIYQAVSGETVYPGFTSFSSPGVLAGLAVGMPIFLALVYFVLMVLTDVCRLTRDSDEERLFACTCCPDLEAAAPIKLDPAADAQWEVEMHDLE